MKSDFIVLFICFIISPSIFELFGGETEVLITSGLNHRTRLGSIEGPLAGEDIFLQAFGGLTPNSLLPVGDPEPHFSNGNPTGVFTLNVTIPHVPIGTPGFVQVAAWDSTVWGKDFSHVLEFQLAFSEVTPFDAFFGIPQPPSSAFLTKSIIVPAIPEPSTWALIGMGALLIGTINLKKR